MKIKLLNRKSLKTLKSLHKNLTQKRAGATKKIQKENDKRNKIDKDLYQIEREIRAKAE